MFRETPAARERDNLFALLLPEESRLRDSVATMVGARRVKHLTQVMEMNGASLTFRDLLADLSNTQLARLCKRFKLS